jgi:hypothetical protein
MQIQSGTFASRIVVALTVVVCSVLTALTTIAIARIEFQSAEWTRSPHTLPALAETFRAVYPYAWLLPFSTAVCTGFVLIRKKTISLAIAIGSVLFLVHVAWFFFALLAFYLINQRFIG